MQCSGITGTEVTHMKLSTESKLLLAMVVGTVAIVGIAIAAFSRPAATYSRTEMITATSQTRGNKDAKVYLVEFSDFQCPACASFAPLVEEIVKQNNDNLAFAYRHFPLDQHPFAERMAIAAEAAGRQGKFWEMGNLLFKNQENMSDDTINQLANDLKLNMDQFTKDRADSAIKDLIQADKAAGMRFGVDATPTFYLNGQKLTLTTQADLKVQVEQAIKQN